MTADYYTRIYEPMTRAHYAVGGWYTVMRLMFDGSQPSYFDPVKILTLDEALAFRGDRVRSIWIEYPESEAA